MSFSQKMQNQLEEILSAGGGVEISAKTKMHNQLVDLAKCAKRNGAHLSLTQASGLMHNQLIDIARAGAGHVSFKD